MKHSADVHDLPTAHDLPDPPTRRRPAPTRPDTRTALLEAGRKVFAHRGFDGASVRDITREAGANLGAITYHFGSKRALYSAVLERCLTPVVDRVGAAAGGEGTPTERLAAVIEVFFEQVAGNQDLPRLILQEVSAGKQPPPQVVANIQRNLGYIVGILRDGWASGEMRRTHPVLTAGSVVSQVVFMAVMAPLIKQVGDLDLIDPETRKAATEHVKTFVRAALEPREEA